MIVYQLLHLKDEPSIVFPLTQMDDDGRSNALIAIEKLED